jgi:hypothetical protein
MRGALERTSTPSLFAYLAGADAFVWLCALPFDLYCRTALACHGLNGLGLAFTLVANAAFAALMISALAVSGELVYRGSFSRRGGLFRFPLRSKAD